jgi:acyl-CoA thioester hydrolase
VSRPDASLLFFTSLAANTLHVFVHWGEMDSFGHLNNVHYLRYFESARVTYLGASGWMAPAPNNVRPILVETQIKYRAQVVFPAILILTTTVLEMREKGCTVATIFRNGDEIVAEARAVALSFDYKLQKTVAMPPAVVEYAKQVDSFLEPEVKQRLLATFKQ